MFTLKRLSPFVALMLLLTFIFLPGGAASAVSANFEGYAVGTLGSALAIPGVSFFGSPDNQWLIYPGGPDVGGVFSTVTGQILIDPVADGAPSGLEIYFDTPQASVSFKFVAGHIANPPANISVSADNAGVLGYTGFLPMSVPPGGSYYEGTFSVSGPLTHLVLVTDQTGFGIDDLVSTEAASSGDGFFTDFEPYAHGTPAEALGLPGAVIGSPFAPDSWQVEPNTDYATLSGNILQNTQCNAALIIALDHTYTEVSFRFGVEPTAAVVMLDGWVGEPGPGTLAFSLSFHGAPMGSPTGMLEGVASSSGTPFDHLIIYSPGGCLAIDDLKVSSSGGLTLSILVIPDNLPELHLEPTLQVQPFEVIVPLDVRPIRVTPAPQLQIIPNLEVRPGS